MTEVDPNVRFGLGRWRARGLDELLGFVKGIITDGAVSDAEAVALHQLLEANPALATEWPANVLADRLERIFADGVIEEEEREDLVLLLQRATGESEGSAEPMTRATRLPVDEPPPDLIFEKRLFVLTGKFVTGKRAFCEAAVERLGGWCDSRITRETDYLVIGTLASEAWVHTTHGRKIEAAVVIKAQGHPISIVAEEHWAMAVRARG